jgi:hypothetical protein
MAANAKSQKVRASLLVNGTLILICLVWLLPTLGIPYHLVSAKPGHLQLRLVDGVPTHCGRADRDHQG